LINRLMSNDLEGRMDTVVSATDARVHFGELMRQVMETGKAVTVERGGKPAVVVVPVAEYEHLLELEHRRREDWWKRLDAIHARIRAEIGDRPVPDTDELIREMREERSREIDEASGVVR
jgi:prevent-host-death family protein